jgi:SAM-dependent methyltransferase
MDWRIKAILQKGMSWLPGGVSLNDLLQRTLGGRRNPGQYVDEKVTRDWLVHVGHLKELGHDCRNQELVEIGTGWAPVLPLCFAIAAGCRCHTYDILPHLSWVLTRSALVRLERHLSAMAQAVGEEESVLVKRWRWLCAATSLGETLERARIECHAPADASATGLPPASVDLVFSNNVLEHVSAAMLTALMREAARILKPSGVVLHGVNCGDHYAYFDRSITPIHYLRFSSRDWQRFNNDIHYQNRLRPCDFLEAARGAGLRIVLQRQTPQAALLARLTELPIAAEFSGYPPEELCSTSIDFAARPSEVLGRSTE